MSKPTLKKGLQEQTKEQFIEQVLDLYDNNKVVKEFYELYLNSLNEKELFEKYKVSVANNYEAILKILKKNNKLKIFQLSE
ncbi:MAG: DUF6155 family protein [Bacteroidales bacterium]|jgi:hypothetical protein|nr:DUF6155 family protein [Bacteroidales bacterium]